MHSALKTASEEIGEKRGERKLLTIFLLDCLVEAKYKLENSALFKKEFYAHSIRVLSPPEKQLVVILFYKIIKSILLSSSCVMTRLTSLAQQGGIECVMATGHHTEV